MLAQVRHKITYRYSRPVFVEPTLLRLRPRSDAHQQLLSYNLNIDAPPAGLRPIIDVLGNSVDVAWFTGLHDRLDVTATSRVQLLLEHPFNYLVTDPGVLRLPARYSHEDPAVLQSYLHRESPAAQVDEMAQQIAAQADHDTSGFLRGLVTHIHDYCENEAREQGDSLPPAETLASRKGACRDLAVLLVDACRSVGLAARFVSGYHIAEADQFDLHAWAEVYLPGAGWRGYDPASGLATADRHLALVAAPEPPAAAPTTGSFRGTEASSSLEFAVDLEVIQP